MKKTKKLLYSFVLIIVLAGIAAFVPDEGMYPLSEVGKIDLVKAGLKIKPIELYNPNGVSIIDALVKLGGCSASFVSEEGLIITNHHCAFGAISDASTPEKNYLQNGFVAMTKADEVPAKGMTAQIMESYEDVSEKVLAAAAGIDDVVERNKKIAAKMRELGTAAEDKEKSIVASVSEMFIGQTYVLFKYRVIRDVRLVYAPPRAIGEFGGESDNWVWPRHTGDFTFVRAYVAPDGKAANYSKENIPFKPKKFLKVNPNGVKENDFVFILGYPGRTFRHQPAKFIEYQEDYQLPTVAGVNQWRINLLEKLSQGNVALQLKYASEIKGLANTMKNYRGKIQGLRRIDLVEKKRAEEEVMQKFIDSKKDLKAKYGTLLAEINEVYESIFSYTEANSWLGNFTRYSNFISNANFILTYVAEMKKPEADRARNYKAENIEKTKADFLKKIEEFDMKMETETLNKFMFDVLSFKGNTKIDAFADVLTTGKPEEAVQNFITGKIISSKLNDKEFVAALLAKTPEEIETMNIPLLNFAKNLNDQKAKLTSVNERNDGTLGKLLPKLTEVKKEFKKTSFIPDANSTLRLTYGYIKGYKPADAMYYSPITTLAGVMDKSTQGGDYIIPAKLKELYEKKDFGRFYNKSVDGIPVAILYNMDTTGGNSGSPIMNAKGELIGVNFDRAYEATINDYAWNESYSRSIGVDIRYVLWVTEKVGGAGHLLTEMGVK